MRYRAPIAGILLGLGLWLISANPAAAQDGEEGREAAKDPVFAPDVRKTGADPRKPAGGNHDPRPETEAPKSGNSKTIRTLDEINIEGEIAVPQVLFIMARDRQRYHDRLHLLYLKSSLEIGRETPYPTGLATRLVP